MDNPWKGKKVLITGVCGTVGSELLRQLLDQPVKEVIGIDNRESEVFFISEEYKDNDKSKFYVCDIRYKERLKAYFESVDIVIHSAALKHVILNERSPFEAIYTNILGTQNIIEAAKEKNVERVLFTSSDKAVNPTNVMGTSKLMGERIITAANSSKKDQYPIFASTRFGNVLGSSGSVIPIFKQQIINGKNITVTHPEMSRFIMTLKEAARLVIDSVFLANGGEVFVTKMPSINIYDLAEVMIDVLLENKAISKPPEIKIIGTKPGEKLYEELISEEEIRRTLEINNYFAVLPAFKSEYQDIEYKFKGIEEKRVDKIYRSDKESKMSKEDLKKYLIKNKLI